MVDVPGYLKQAGFNDDEIASWATETRGKLKAGGFTDAEADEYFGQPKTPETIPPALIDRVLQGQQASNVINAVGKGAVEGFGSEPLGFSEKSIQELRGLGVFGDPDKGTQTPLRFMNEALLRPAAAAGDALFRVLPMLAGGVAGGVSQVAKESGVEENSAEKLKNETFDALNIVAMFAGGDSAIASIKHAPGGGITDTKIGGLPKGEDFSAASTTLGHGDTTPVMEGKLADLYEQKGIHPAEVAHDADSDVTITQSMLSVDKQDVPAAYGPKEDILTERAPSSAGAAAAPQIPYSDAEKQILSKISIGEQAPEAKLTWDKVYTNFLDKLYPLSKAVKESGEALPAEENPYELARLLSGHVGKADHFLNNATFDFTTYEQNGPSLKSILNPVRGDLNGFRAYATAARALELEDRGIRSGFAEEASAPPLVSSGLDAARTVVVEGRDKFEQPFRDLIAYQNRVTQYLRDSGVLSADGYEAMVEANKMYVPFTRVMGIDETAQARGGSTLQAKNPIKAIKGSARSIVDPIESVVRNTYHMVEMAEKNVVGTKLVDMLKRASEELPEAPAAVENGTVKDTPRARAMTDELASIGVKGGDELAAALDHASEERKPGEIAILRDGQRETYKVDPDLARAMKGLDAQSMGLLEKALSYPASTLRAGAVTTPDFALRHTVRDFLYAFTTFKDGVFNPMDMARGFSGLIMKDGDYWDWLKGGGGNISMVGLDRQYLQADLRKLTGETGLVGRAWNVLTDPEASMWDKTAATGKLPFQAIDKFVLDPLRAATAFAENASHLGAFKKSMRAFPPEATDLRSQIIRSAWASRDTAVDAARMGANMRAYNMITAFANIKLQDTDRVVRAIKDDPLGSITKIGAAITVPSVVLWAANHNDPRYAEIPQWQKDMFWLVMTPEHVFRIPKPWAMGMVFGTLPERMLDAFVAHKPEAFKDYFHQLWETSGPDFLPSAAAPIVDQFANRSTFTNRTLIPSSQEKFLPEYQYTPYTTELTKALGRTIGAFPGMDKLKMDNSGFGGVARALTSPILMENYIRGWTGTLGTYALNAADKGLRMAGQLPDPPKPASTLADIPVIRAFVVRYPSASAESVQQFYDRYEANRKFFDTWNAMAKDGNVAAMTHIQQMGGPTMFAQLDGIKQTLAEHNQIIRDIYKNPQIPPAEKRQLIDTLYGNMVMVARSGNDALRQMQEKAANVVSSGH